MKFSFIVKAVNQLLKIQKIQIIVRDVSAFAYKQSMTN